MASAAQTTMRRRRRPVRAERRRRRREHRLRGDRRRGVRPARRVGEHGCCRWGGRPAFAGRGWGAQCAVGAARRVDARGDIVTHDGSETGGTPGAARLAWLSVGSDAGHRATPAVRLRLAPDGTSRPREPAGVVGSPSSRNLGQTHERPRLDDGLRPFGALRGRRSSSPCRSPAHAAHSRAPLATAAAAANPAPSASAQVAPCAPARPKHKATSAAPLV